MLPGHATLVINAAELAHSTSCFVETMQHIYFPYKNQAQFFLGRNCQITI